MATKRRIKFIKPWNMFGVGQELELDEPIAFLLIERGRAVEVKPPEPAPALSPATAPKKVKKKHK